MNITDTVITEEQRLERWRSKNYGGRRIRRPRRGIVAKNASFIHSFPLATPSIYVASLMVSAVQKDRLLDN